MQNKKLLILFFELSKIVLDKIHTYALLAEQLRRIATVFATCASLAVRLTELGTVICALLAVQHRAEP
jgi:hypothetical protein